MNSSGVQPGVLERLTSRSDIVLAVAMIGIIGILVIPIPTALTIEISVSEPES